MNTNRGTEHKTRSRSQQRSGYTELRQAIEAFPAFPIATSPPDQGPWSGGRLAARTRFQGLWKRSGHHKIHRSRSADQVRAGRSSRAFRGPGPAEVAGRPGRWRPVCQLLIHCGEVENVIETTRRPRPTTDGRKAIGCRGMAHLPRAAEHAGAPWHCGDQRGRLRE